MTKQGQLWEDLKTARTMPRRTISLMASAAQDNDPFYRQVVTDTFSLFTSRHPRFPLVRQVEFGVALCELPGAFDEYFMGLEGSARRNVRKARKLGYRFEKIDYNLYLDDVTEIRQSADVRQGALPEEFLKKSAERCDNPPSRTTVHDYPFFGVLKGGKLLAYANCLVCGEVCLLEHIYGHARFMSDGIVPMLVCGIAEYVLDQHEKVRYFAYGTYFGASKTMRRFKRKFGFAPHRVTWILGD